jgi:hypothetical protein
MLERMNDTVYSKDFMSRFVGQMTSLSKETLDKYKSWLKGLSDDEFHNYLEKWADFSNPLWGVERGSPGKVGTTVAGEAHQIGRVNSDVGIEMSRREAAIYFALALWKAFDARESGEAVR